MSKFQIVKLSKCQSNCQIVTISNVMYYQGVWMRLAHRLYSDFQYFLLKNTPVCKMSVKIHNKMEAKSFKINKKAKKYF